MFVRFIASALLCALLASCGGGNDTSSTAVFVFRMHGLPASEAFRVITSSPELIAQARAQLALTVSERHLFASGPIRAGDGGHNTGWSWHFTDVTLVEASIELCDGRPSMVEADLNYWLNTVQSFCPWGSYVHAQVQ